MIMGVDRHNIMRERGTVEEPTWDTVELKCGQKTLT